MNKIGLKSFVAIPVEIAVDESDAAWATSQEVEKRKRLTQKDQSTLSKIQAMVAKEKAKKKSVAESLKEGAAQHKVLVMVSDPNHTAVTKRKEQVMKRVIVNADDKNHAVVKAREFYKKKGYKVHDAEYHSPQPKSSMKTESVEEAFADQGSGTTGQSREDKRIAKLLQKKHKQQTPTKEQGVAEGESTTQKYEMMMRNGQVKKFVAKDDVDAKRIAAGHGAKSVIRMKGNVPGDKIGKQGVAEEVEEIEEAKIPVDHVIKSVTKVLGTRGAARFATHLRSGTDKHTSWDKVNSALMSQGIKPQHIANISIHVKPAMHEEVVDEGLVDDMLAIAKKRNPNAKIAGNVDQQKKERDDMLKKREADRAGQPKHTPVRDPKHDPEDRGYGSRRYMGDSVEYKEVEEATDKDHPIVKEFNALKKNHDIKSLRNLIKGQHKIIDTSEFRTKEHAISSYLRTKHGDKRVADAFGLKEETELEELTTNTLNRYTDAANKDFNRAKESGDSKKMLKRGTGLLNAVSKKIKNTVKTEEYSTMNQDKSNQDRLKEVFSFKDFLNQTSTTTSEELTELSADTLKSYDKKGTMDYAEKRMAGDDVEKRRAGVKKARAKLLAKEETMDDIDNEEDEEDEEDSEIEEAKDTKEIDPKTGKVKSWKHEGDWKKSDKKNPIGKVHQMSDTARRKTADLKEEELDEIATTGMSHQGKTTLKHIKNPTVTQRMAARDIKPGVAGYRDRIDALRDAKARGNLKEEEVDLEEVVDEGLADDMLAIAKKRNPNAKIAGNVDQQKKERDDMLKKREADRAGQPKHTPVRDPKHDPEDRGYGSRRYMGDSVEYKEVEEATDKDHPIVKEFNALKKNHDIKSLRNLIKGQHKIIDTSEFRTKEHAISSYLRTKHGDKRVADAFGLKEETELEELTTNTLNRYTDAANKDFNRAKESGDSKKMLKRGTGLLNAVSKKIKNTVKTEEYSTMNQDKSNQDRLKEVFSFKDFLNQTSTTTSEELTELSADTLKSYDKKGTMDYAEKRMAGDDVEKRRAGVKKARAKLLAKEETMDDIDNEEDEEDEEDSEIEEAKDTKEIDPKTGKVKSWKHEGDWKKSDKKNPIGKVHQMSDTARRKTADLKEEELDEIATTGMSHQGKTTLKHIKNPTVTQRMAARDIKPGVAGYRDRIDALRDAKARGNLKEEEIDETMKTTHRNPLVLVRDHRGDIATHANLSVANSIHGSNVKSSDIHSGRSVKSGKHTFTLSKHHVSALKEDEESDSLAERWDDVKNGPDWSKYGLSSSDKNVKKTSTGLVHKARETARNPEGGDVEKRGRGRPAGEHGTYKIDKAKRDDPEYKQKLSQKVMAAKAENFKIRKDFKDSMNSAIKTHQAKLYASNK